MKTDLVLLDVKGVGELFVRINGVSAGSLPMAMERVDMGLVAQTIGPIEHGADEVKWSPVNEVFRTHGVFHG